MNFDAKAISHLAALSRLQLNQEECTKLASQLSNVLSYVEGLAAVDVNGVEPMTHAVPADLPLREDLVQPSAAHAALKGSAGFEDGLVKVPKIIE